MKDTVIFIVSATVFFLMGLFLIDKIGFEKTVISELSCIAAYLCAVLRKLEKR